MPASGPSQQPPSASSQSGPSVPAPRLSSGFSIASIMNSEPAETVTRKVSSQTTLDRAGLSHSPSAPPAATHPSTRQSSLPSQSASGALSPGPLHHPSVPFVSPAEPAATMSGYLDARDEQPASQLKFAIQQEPFTAPTPFASQPAPAAPPTPTNAPVTAAADEAKPQKKRKSTAGKKRQSEPDENTETGPDPKAAKPRVRKPAQKQARKSKDAQDDSTIMADLSSLADTTDLSPDTPASTATATAVPKKPRAPKRAPAKPKKSATGPDLASDQPVDSSDDTTLRLAEPVEKTEKADAAAKPKRKKKAKPNDPSADAMDVDASVVGTDDVEIPAAALLGAFIPPVLPPLEPPTESSPTFTAVSKAPSGGSSSNSQFQSTNATQNAAPTQPAASKPSARKAVDLPPALSLLPGMGGPPVNSDSTDLAGTDIYLTFPLKGQNNVTLNFAREIEKKYGLAALNPRIAAANSRKKAILKIGDELERQERARKTGVADDGSGDDLQSMDLNSDEGGSDADPMDVDMERKRLASPTHSSSEHAQLRQMKLDPEKWKFAKNGRLIRRRKRRQEEYDRNDEFIDDTEMAWDEQARMAQDGFFVYSGPLALEDGKSDAAKPSRARSKAKKAAGEDGAPKPARSRAKAATQANGTAPARKRAPKTKAAAPGDAPMPDAAAAPAPLAA